MTDALKTFLARIGSSSETAGIDVDRWRDADLDLGLLEKIHRAVVGGRETVRRILADGRSVLAPAQPGHVRTKPQALRIGDHVEKAWEQGDLRSGLVALCREVAPLAARDPVRASAQLVWALSRAQPFTGLNERVALVVASWLLRRAGLAVLDVERVERDSAFEVALISANADDRSLLERYLVDAMWDEALAIAEAVPAPPQGAQRWTLADELGAASQARADAAKLSADELTMVVDHLSTRLAVPGLSLGVARREWLESQPARLACAWDATMRGRRISPHQPVLLARWSVTSAPWIELKLVIGAAGRGTTGATAAHLALELADQAVAGTAPALLLVPDEPRDERLTRSAAWLDRALANAIEQSPLRI